MGKRGHKGKGKGEDGEGLHEISDILDESMEFHEPKWVVERYM